MIRKALLTIVCLIFSFVVWADAPITATVFWKAYKDLPIIKKATTTRELSKDMIVFFESDKNSIDKKVAIINALGVNYGGKRNSYVFYDFLEKKYGVKRSRNKFKKLCTGDELLCVGYLEAMEDYFNSGMGRPMVRAALKKNKTSYTYNIILAILNAQADFNHNWCTAFHDVDKIRKNTKLVKDFRETGIKIIFDYFDSVKENCD